MSKSIIDSQLCQSDSEEMCNHNIDESNDECSKTQWARNMRAGDGKETDSSTERNSKNKETWVCLREKDHNSYPFLILPRKNQVSEQSCEWLHIPINMTYVKVKKKMELLLASLRVHELFNRIAFA